MAKKQAAKAASIPVTMRALIARINRKLAGQDEVLKATRGERARYDLGDYWLLNFRNNWVAGKNIDPEALGRNIGVLKKWERVVE